MRFREWLAREAFDRPVADKILGLLMATIPGGQVKQLNLDRRTPSGARDTRSSGFSYEAEFEGRVFDIKVFPEEPYDADSSFGAQAPVQSSHGSGFVEFGFYDPEAEGEEQAYQVVGPQVKQGSKAIFDKLKLLWAQLKQLGVAVAYHPMKRPASQLTGGPANRTEDQRGRIYGKMLSRLGFQQNYQGDKRTVWQ